MYANSRTSMYNSANESNPELEIMSIGQKFVCLLQYIWMEIGFSVFRIFFWGG